MRRHIFQLATRTATQSVTNFFTPAGSAILFATRSSCRVKLASMRCLISVAVGVSSGYRAALSLPPSSRKKKHECNAILVSKPTHPPNPRVSCESGGA